MTDHSPAKSVLAKMFEHNQWANLAIIRACLALADLQLDARPRSATKGTVRETLVHLVAAQRGYLALLTMPVDARQKTPVLFAELLDAARSSGEALVDLVSHGELPETTLRTTDGHYVEPWVVLVQVINHATEHREQISSMLSALGVTPPDLDGWTYGEVSHALVPVSS